MDVNVLSVDWSPLSATPWYPVARANVDVVGPRLAALLDWLVGHGVYLGSVHLVGHSLGAHVAGVAGANLRTGRVSRISGEEMRNGDEESSSVIRQLATKRGGNSVLRSICAMGSGHPGGIAGRPFFWRWRCGELASLG